MEGFQKHVLLWLRKRGKNKIQFATRIFCELEYSRLILDQINFMNFSKVGIFFIGDLEIEISQPGMDNFWSERRCEDGV